MEENKLKKFLGVLGYQPLDGEVGFWFKKYADNSIKIDFEKEKIDYGKINSGRKTTQNFKDDENWVVLECVDRLLERGYKPEDIILEQKYTVGHGASGGWLDIVVKKDGKTFLMIECKTWGKEFEKELKNINKNGGQLFTYFQNDKNADFLILYASKFDEKNDKIEYKNEIVVIEDSYRESVYNIQDLFNRWNKFTKQNGIFESWINAYNFESKSLTLQDLKPIKEEDSHFIFNRFLEILRHNTVSDKPNAFNKIFTLFLCKIKDEDKNNNEELEFQWKEGEDDHITFQKRLSDLYKKAMYEFLDKTISDFSDKDFESKYQHLTEKDRIDILKEITKLRLQKNNEFAIKDVFDEETFNENGKVLKEVVELLQPYKFRYEKKQPFLGNFFELLLTTGLKQESGQFFTPVPIVRFICKSIPLKKVLLDKLEKGRNNELLPSVIDYSAGSGHFLTESMEEIQNIIDKLDNSNFTSRTKNQIESWRINQFNWASDYVYGIELDYRLVKTAKVGCYLHGDGIANVTHGDGLDSFASKKYKGRLENKLAERNDEDNKNYQDNSRFDFVLSNPPYSVSSFKGNMKNKNAKNDFELYKYLTDESKEIESLFIERTKQLLKEGGIAGIVLPSSILSNPGMHLRSREIIFKYFDIVAIAEFSTNAFIATDIKTITLFLRRKNDYDFSNIKNKVDNNFVDKKDSTIKGFEKSFSKYLSYVWSEETKIDFSDYKTLIDKHPNEKIKNHEIFQEYGKKIKSKNENEMWQKIHDLEKEKITYFLTASNQKIVLVKTGKKRDEKKFLGYFKIDRRTKQGLQSFYKDKDIDECTQLFDPDDFYNSEKASTYILEAFEKKEERMIPNNLKKNISRIDLVDMMNFKLENFDKNISLQEKINFSIKSSWKLEKISNLLINLKTDLQSGNRPKGGVGEYDEGVPSLGGEHINLNGLVSFKSPKFVPYSFYKKAKQGLLKEGDILICKDGALTGKIAYFSFDNLPYNEAMINEHVFLLRFDNEIIQKYIFHYLFSKDGQALLKSKITGQAQGGLNRPNLLNIKIPLPDSNIQKDIVNEIEKLEKKSKKIVIENLQEEKEKIIKKYL